MNGSRHGTVIERTRDRGRPVRAVSRHGHELWRATWDGARLLQLVAFRPDRGEVVLEANGGEDALFGPVHAIVVDGKTVAVCGAVDWDAPRFVPPISRPGAMPPGAGSPILDFLARQAGDAPLRYRGPYPTAALFDALLHSFAVDDPADALRRFTEDVDTRAIAGAMHEVDVEFRPAPHEWIWPAPGVCVELRDGVERLFVRGQVYARGTTDPRQVVREGAGWAAQVSIAGEPWCETVRVDVHGEVIDGPHPIPAVASPLLGVALPDEIRAVLAEVLAARDGGPFAFGIANALRQRALVWSDTSDALAVGDDAEVRVHALLGERLAERSSEQVLALLVDAIEPVVRRLAVADLTCTSPGSA